MKKLLTLLSVLFCISSIGVSAPGDTIRVEGKKEIHWNWAGNFRDTLQFPTSGTFQKVRLRYILGCPSIGCSEWDYKTNIEVWDTLPDGSPDRTEICRIITPYAGNRNNGWFHEYIVDISDYASLLKGERIINAYYGGYQDGFTVSLIFEFIEGTPGREAHKVSKIYRSGPNGFEYGYASNPIENHLSNKNITLSSQTQSSKFRMMATGHGFNGNGFDPGNPDNCAEFCDKWFKLKVNNAEVYQETVWNDDCGSEAIFPQPGTWLLNRAGWCPGGHATVYEHELTSHISGTSANIDVDWQPYTYTSGSSFPIHYWLEAQLIEYKAANFTRDADLDMILVPSTHDRYTRFNPSCGNAKIRVKNNGSSAISKLKVKYGIENKHTNTFEWSGTIAAWKNADIELPVDYMFFYGNENNNTIFAEIIEVNGSADENSTNNKVYSNFENPKVLPAEFMVQVKTNNFGNQTWYYLRNTITGDTVLSMDNLGNNITYRDTLNLEMGCYEFFVGDRNGDGLQWWANQQQAGTGFARLTNLQLNTSDPIFMETLGADFGNFNSIYFTVGFTTQIQKINAENFRVLAYPNPVNSMLTVEIENNNENAQLVLFDALGKKVFEKALSQSLLLTEQIDVSHLSSGLYILEVRGKTQNKKIKVTIQR